ncbi:ketopantoate reductase family protein [Rhizobium oryzicola]|uniref:2-dehydropantoate 2-reductase n=1 Tax=Rhizobium oryzicola TaxID=1232668 RepID=A0ABT8SW22_9HYPH|nr:ketopantoate reductase family protein [Rhizobium oryzicola]MDO1582647.1 ketopantoate reductase family protein [Rhizobium oryzicola]
MRIVVIGSGAMGSLFAGRLAASGEDVSLVEVNPAQIDAVKERGLRLTIAGTDEIHNLPIGPAQTYSGVYDLVIVFTKGMHTEAAVNGASHLIGPETLALTVQNGIGNVEKIETVIPRARIIKGMTNWPATVVETGHVNVPGSGEIHLWPALGDGSPRFDEVCHVLNKAGLNCVADRSVDASIWEKLSFNAALNSVAAVTCMTVGEMSDSAEARKIIFSVLDEALATASALGVAIDRDRTRQSVEYALANHRHHKPSMLQDRLGGRPMEIDTITGAVASHAERLAVPAPVTATLTNLLLLIGK